jgi:hypothetical protein
VALENLIYASIDREALDPRDHVYALLWVVSVTLSLTNLSRTVEADILGLPEGYGQHLQISDGSRFPFIQTQTEDNNRAFPVCRFSKKGGLGHMDHLHLYQCYGGTNAGATNGRETLNAIHDIHKGTITLTGTIVSKITTTQIFTTEAMLSNEASSMPSNAEELPVMQPSMKILLFSIYSFTTIS